jgi:hypothetical protein
MACEVSRTLDPWGYRNMGYRNLTDSSFGLTLHSPQSRLGVQILRGAVKSKMSNWVKRAAEEERQRRYNEEQFPVAARRLWEALSARIRADVHAIREELGHRVDCNVGDDADVFRINKPVLPAVALTVRFSISARVVQTECLRFSETSRQPIASEQQFALAWSGDSDLRFFHKGGMMSPEDVSELLLAPIISR